MSSRVREAGPSGPLPDGPDGHGRAGDAARRSTLARAAVPAFLLTYAAQVAWLITVAAGSLVGVLLALAAAAATALLWPIGRRLGLGTVPSAAAVLLAGTALVLVGVPVPPAWGAVLCMALAGVLACAPGRVWLAAPPFVLAGLVLAPLSAVGLLVLGALLLADGALGTRWTQRTRWVAAAAAGLVALAVAVLATGDGPLAVPADTPGWPALLAALGIAAGAVLAWLRAPWLRPVAGATAAACVCAVVPDTSAGALVIAALAAALLVAALVDEHAAAAPPAALLAGIALAFVVAVVGLVVVAVGDDTQPIPAEPVPAAEPGPPEPAPAVEPVPAAAPQAGASGAVAAAAGWLANDLAADASAACEPSICDALAGAGVPVQRMIPLDPGPAGPHVRVLPAGDRADLRSVREGTQLLGQWVDDAGDGLEVRAPLPAPDQVRSAADERERFGAELAENPRLGLTPEAADALRAGHVDPRLMTVLAGLAGSHDVRIGDLPTAQGAASNAPRRAAVITAMDGVSTTDPTAATALRDWLAGQAPPYRADVVTRTGGHVEVNYRAPSPSTPPSG